MPTYEQFKHMVEKCWETQDNYGHSINNGDEEIAVCFHHTDEGEPLVWVALFSYKIGGLLRGDSIYAEGMDDEYLQGVFKYITTGEEY